ncbi:hypothetical protein N7447_004957 [Penicillium robsamsonii]|uniref:uncharacterized protein n=1 Tax=Penicillium robsamsonii TaxID=1792511 RepID=UPI0025490547|nr:uncharacterized protein N7447_004957 [Penicillium robsamsonii]KAJ5822617.1 hypothetical protein N7447_004957 [Penicillium robsamsonii]
MQSILAIVYLLCYLVTMVEGLSRYHTTPPSDVIIVHDRQSLNDLVKVNPETILHSENGGYYLKNMEEEVVAITADDLCEELDAAFASIDAGVIGDDSGPEDLDSESLGGANITKRLSCYPHCVHNSCSHPRCFNSATCLTYTSCHVCSTSSRKLCI